jgi:prevent-host-death family protein
LEEIAISKFKATCLAVLERVRRTRQPVRVTRFGTPIAEIVPPPPPSRPEGWVGAMVSTGQVTGDIVGPAGGERDWDVFG